MSKGLVERGHDVIVYTTDAKDLHSRINNDNVEIDGIKVQYLRNISMFTVKKSRFFITPRILSRVKEELRTFDVIHLHEYRTFQNMTVAYYARKYGIPYVLQAHGSLPKTLGKQKLKWIYDNLYGFRLLQDASKVIALSKAEAEQYKNMDVRSENIVIIPNGIDLSEFRNLPHKGFFKRKFGIGHDEKIVLFLGRISRIKGVDILVRAFAQLTKKLNNVKLVIAGPDYGQLNEIKTLSNTLNTANNVLITGPLYGKDKLAAYVDSEVYVLPSRYEIWGMTVLEAYACSKPVITSNVQGLSSLVVPGETGLLFETGNAEELAKALLYLLLNPEKKVQMGIRGKKLVSEKYAMVKVVGALEATYRQICSEKNR